jgi:hypothetical protein
METTRTALDLLCMDRGGEDVLLDDVDFLVKYRDLNSSRFFLPFITSLTPSKCVPKNVCYLSLHDGWDWGNAKKKNG